MKHLPLLCIIIAFMQPKLYSQDAVAASGGNATGSNVSVSYTVGQVAYTTQTGSNGSVAQGVQQPYEIYLLSGAQFSEIKVSILAYPNPTQNVLTIDIQNQEINAMRYVLVDIQGRQIAEAAITDAHTVLQLENLPSASYILKILSQAKEIKTFKIIKN